MERRTFLSASAALMAAWASPQSELYARDYLLIPDGLPSGADQDGLIPVAVAISQNTTAIDYIGPWAVFETWLYNAELQRPQKKFDLFTVSENTDPIENALKVTPTYSFADAPPARIVIVPAQTGSAALFEWLKQTALTADVVMSVCVGARHLAKAGLLDGKTATTHHKSLEPFKKEFPAVNWISGVRFARAGNIYTGGGLTAGIDLALHIVEQYFGRPAAQGVADHLEYQSTGWITNK